MNRRFFLNSALLGAGGAMIPSKGDWAIDFHTRLDMPDAVRLSSLIEELNPYFVEDLMMELTGDGPKTYPYLPQVLDFKNGKLWPNGRPGLGVEFDPQQAQLIAEITELAENVRGFRRPDGSYTNW